MTARAKNNCVYKEPHPEKFTVRGADLFRGAVRK